MFPCRKARNSVYSCELLNPRDVLADRSFLTRYPSYAFCAYFLDAALVRNRHWSLTDFRKIILAQLVNLEFGSE